ncbi:hypothetical protein CLOM_g6063 [Closterium sp. NIES-68]|nr:hypothetical protein CLOM_g6063 [Closterium sp. NIES-68]
MEFPDDESPLFYPADGMLSGSELFLSSALESSGALVPSPEWMRCDVERPAVTLGDAMCDVMGDVMGDVMPERVGDASLCERQRSLDPPVELLPFCPDTFCRLRGRAAREYSGFRASVC